MDHKFFENIEIYAFHGKMGTGKNFISEKIFSKMLEEKPTITIAFADHFKIDVITKDNIDRYRVWDKKDSISRKKLQNRGTKEGREKYGDNIWVNTIKEFMIAHINRGIKRFIINDLRFKNEFEFIKSIGGYIIKIEAPERNLISLKNTYQEKYLEISNHISEVDLDEYNDKFDFVIKNDEKDQEKLYINCREVVREIIKKESTKKDSIVFVDLDNTICECNIYYILISETVKKIIKSSLVDYNNDFDKEYSDSVTKHNADYSSNYIFLQKFSDSLVKVFNDFTQYMNPQNLAEIRGEVWNLGMSVFDFEYSGIENRVEQLRELQKDFHVVIYTMGDRQEQVKKITQLGLFDLDFEIFDFKDETVFRYLIKKYPSKNHYMIGDSYDRDIIPAINAGANRGYHVIDNKESYWYKQKEKEAHPSIVSVNDIKEAHIHILKTKLTSPALRFLIEKESEYTRQINMDNRIKFLEKK